MKMTSILFILSLFTICNPSQPNNGVNFKDYVKYWELETGSHIAYIHIPANDYGNSIPVIFLHGGPGACQVNSFGKEAPVEWYTRLAKHQFDIYIYDQVGCGLSGRLADPSQYTVDRHVLDLESIRVIAGNKPCILIGDSWGATLASHYITKYPENVLKAIFTAPGSIDIREWNDEYSGVPVFPSGWYGWIKDQYGNERLNRYFKLDSLMQKDVHKAHEFAGDAEMDKLADEFITSAIFSSCVYNKAFTKSPEFRMQGMGWWCSVMTIWDLMNIKPIKNELRKYSKPVLILRGDADYLQPGIANQYNTVFQNSKLVKVPKAGHFIWLDQPGIYQKEIENFLINR